MDCPELRNELLAGGGKAISAAARAHAETCSVCGLLLADDGAMARRLGAAPPVPMDADLELAAMQRLMGGERGLRASLRGARTAARVGVVFLVALVVAGAVLSLRPRADLDVYPHYRLVAGTLALSLAAVVGLWIFVRPLSRPPVGRVQLAAAAALGVVLPFTLAALPQAHRLLEVSLAGAGTDLLPRAVGCLAIGLAVSAPVLAAAWLVDRGGRGAAPWSFAAIAGGLVGNLALELHCPLTGRMHLLLSHAWVTVLVVILVWAFATATQKRAAHP